MNAESPTQMEASASLQLWVFENLLRAFTTGGATSAVVLARVRRLLATGTSPAELLKIVRRSQLIEPLPESAQGVLDLLNNAIRRDAGEAVESAEVQDAEPQAVAPHEEVIEENTARRPTADEAETRSCERGSAQSVHSTLAAEQRRTRDLALALAEKNAVVEASKTHIAEILRDYERQKSEMQTLRDSLAARDTTVLQMQRSLDERDTQLARLQQEHAQVVSTVEAHVESGARLEADLQAARARADAISAELQAGQEAAAQVKRSESRLNAALTELGAVQAQSSSYLELIRTREWRRGFEHNMIRELDAQVGAANEERQALASERDGLQNQLTAADSERARLTAELAKRDRAIPQAEQAALIERLQAEADRREEEMGALRARLQEARHPVQALESDLKRLTEELAAANGERTRLTAELAKRAAHMKRSHTERGAQIERLQADPDRREEETRKPAAVSADPGAAASGAANPSAGLIRVDGDQRTAYVLTKRTCIGRAAACELRIESRSVSRHHALVIVGPRDTIIEDLNSTNGVLVNGTRVTRRALNDGDAVTIGDIRFRYFARLRDSRQGTPHASPEMLRSEAS